MVFGYLSGSLNGRVDLLGSVIVSYPFSVQPSRPTPSKKKLNDFMGSLIGSQLGAVTYVGYSHPSGSDSALKHLYTGNDSLLM